MSILLIVCRWRDLSYLLDALQDWKGIGDICLYGATNKQQDGFILMQWHQPIPERFQQMQLKADAGIIDYLIYDLTALSPATT